MAARKKRRKASKMDPFVQRFLYFDLAHTHSGSGANEDFHYIDLAACMSAINRRLYRQGRLYHVANISVHDSQGDAEVRFATAPNNWTTQKAWETCFQAWKDQRKHALQEMPEGSPQVTGKWSDFKVYLNADMITDVDKPKPVDVEGNALVMYGAGSDNEWNYADVQVRSDGNVYQNLNFTLLGAHSLANNGRVGVIKALEDIWASKAYAPTLPAAFDESPILGMGPSTQAEQEILDAIADENDQPPYSYLDMVGSDDNMPNPITARETSITTTQNEMAMVGGFPVPCGLLMVETKASADNTIGICIELVPGTYKGVHAEAF